MVVSQAEIIRSFQGKYGNQRVDDEKVYSTIVEGKTYNYAGWVINKERGLPFIVPETVAERYREQGREVPVYTSTISPEREELIMAREEASNEINRITQAISNLEKQRSQLQSNVKYRIEIPSESGTGVKAVYIGTKEQLNESFYEKEIARLKTGLGNVYSYEKQIERGLTTAQVPKYDLPPTPKFERVTEPTAPFGEATRQLKMGEPYIKESVEEVTGIKTTTIVGISGGKAVETIYKTTPTITTPSGTVLRQGKTVVIGNIERPMITRQLQARQELLSPKTSDIIQPKKIGAPITEFFGKISEAKALAEPKLTEKVVEVGKELINIIPLRTEFKQDLIGDVKEFEKSIKGVLTVVSPTVKAETERFKESIFKFPEITEKSIIRTGEPVKEIKTVGILEGIKQSVSSEIERFKKSQGNAPEIISKSVIRTGEPVKPELPETSIIQDLKQFTISKLEGVNTLITPEQVVNAVYTFSVGEAVVSSEKYLKPLEEFSVGEQLVKYAEPIAEFVGGTVEIATLGRPNILAFPTIREGKISGVELKVPRLVLGLKSQEGKIGLTQPVYSDIDLSKPSGFVQTYERTLDESSKYYKAGKVFGAGILATEFVLSIPKVQNFLREKTLKVEYSKPQVKTGAYAGENFLTGESTVYQKAKFKSILGDEGEVYLVENVDLIGQAVEGGINVRQIGSGFIIREGEVQAFQKFATQIGKDDLGISKGFIATPKDIIPFTAKGELEMVTRLFEKPIPISVELGDEIFKAEMVGEERRIKVDVSGLKTEDVFNVEEELYLTRGVETKRLLPSERERILEEVNKIIKPSSETFKSTTDIFKNVQTTEEALGKTLPKNLPTVKGDLYVKLEDIQAGLKTLAVSPIPVIKDVFKTGAEATTKAILDIKPAIRTALGLKEITKKEVVETKPVYKTDLSDFEDVYISETSTQIFEGRTGEVGLFNVPSIVSFLPRVEPTSKERVKVAVGTQIIPATKPYEIPSETPIEIPKETPIEIPEEIPEETTIEIPKTTPTSIYETVFTPTNLNIPRITVPTLPIAPITPLGFGNVRNVLGKEKVRAFALDIKVGGKFKRVSGIFTKAEAKLLGKTLIEKSPKASFQITPLKRYLQGKGKGRPVDLSNFLYRKGEKGAEIFVERKERRIKSVGELLGITAKGIIASKKKREEEKRKPKKKAKKQKKAKRKSKNIINIKEILGGF